jgi:hypothetical protein
LVEEIQIPPVFSQFLGKIRLGLFSHCLTSFEFSRNIRVPPSLLLKKGLRAILRDDDT